MPTTEYPQLEGQIYTSNSASSRFYAPSDISRIHGMQWEYICSAPNGRNEGTTSWLCFHSHWQWFWGWQYTKLQHSMSIGFFFIQVQWCYLSLCCHTLVWKDQQCTQWKHRNVEGPSCLSTKPLALHCSYPHWYYILCCSSGSHLWCQLISHDLKPCHAYNMFNMFYVNTYVDHHAFSFAGWSTFYILGYVCSTHQ